MLSLPSSSARPARSGPLGYAVAVGVVATATAVAWSVFGRQNLTDVVMVYLLGVVIASLTLGRGPSLSTAILSVLAFDVFFIPPYWRLSVDNLRHAVTFGVMLLVGVVINHLTRRVRERERRAAALYEMSRDLGGATGRTALVEAGLGHIARLFRSKAVLFVPKDGDLVPAHRTGEPPLDTAEETGPALRLWADHRAEGGPLRAGRGIYFPLHASLGPLGVLGVFPREERRFQEPGDLRLVEALVAQVAAAIERQDLREEAECARLESERERLRSALLSSVSHDLRTPLGVIEGAASTLLDPGAVMDEATRRDLAETIHEEAEGMSRRIRNLLDMTRLDSPALHMEREWQPLEEVVGSTLTHMEERLRGRPVTTSLPATLPLLEMDGVLIQKVLQNLLENALKYSPAGSPLDLSARESTGEIVVTVADRGPGIPPGEKEKVFEKFYRAVRDRTVSGVGLGLAICRAIVTAHGGRIWVENRAGGGAAFHVALPHGENPPGGMPEEERP